jgi:16S rRNA (cytidine1402-2'-O)-methyltransferase
VVYGLVSDVCCLTSDVSDSLSRSKLKKTLGNVAKLYIVSTPIGNLSDITLRAIDTLKKVSLIAAEDTRHTSILLNHYNINTALISFHSFSSKDRINKLIEYLKNGKDVALLSDAGTPGISDPGYSLVKAVIENGFDVVSIPGVCAAIAALSVSGLPTHQFLFVGFLPIKSGARKKILKRITSENQTVVTYISVHRLIKTLEDVADVCPLREVVIAKEITKKFEEVIRGKIEQVLQTCKNKTIKGEYVLIIGPQR